MFEGSEYCWPMGQPVECSAGSWRTLGGSGHCGLPPGLAPPSSHQKIPLCAMSSLPFPCTASCIFKILMFLHALPQLQNTCDFVCLCFVNLRSVRLGCSSSPVSSTPRGFSPLWFLQLDLGSSFSRRCGLGCRPSPPRLRSL